MLVVNKLQFIFCTMYVGKVLSILFLDNDFMLSSSDGCPRRDPHTWKPKVGRGILGIKKKGTGRNRISSVCNRRFPDFSGYDKRGGKIKNPQFFPFANRCFKSPLFAFKILRHNVTSSAMPDFPFSTASTFCQFTLWATPRSCITLLASVRRSFTFP